MYIRKFISVYTKIYRSIYENIFLHMRKSRDLRGAIKTRCCVLKKVDSWDVRDSYKFTHIPVSPMLGLQLSIGISP